MIDKNLDRKTQEQGLILDFIQWLNNNKPAPDPYEYMVTIHDRLSLTPTVALYIISKHAKNSKEAIGGVTIQMPSQWDVLDGIKHLWNEVMTQDVDLRDLLQSLPQ